MYQNHFLNNHKQYSRDMANLYVKFLAKEVDKLLFDSRADNCVMVHYRSTKGSMTPFLCWDCNQLSACYPYVVINNNP